MDVTQFLPSPSPDSIVLVSVITLAALVLGLWVLRGPKVIIISLTLLQGLLAWTWTKMTKHRRKK